MPAPICEGLNVLELGTGSIAASLAGMLLADNGARVLKIEPPDGDRLRTAIARPGSWCGTAARRAVPSTCAPTKGRAARRHGGAQADVLIDGVSRRAGADGGVSATSAARGQPGSRPLLDHRFRPDRAVRAICRVRGRRGGQDRPCAAAARSASATARSSTTRRWASTGAAHTALARHPCRPDRPRAARAGASGSTPRSCRA